MPPTPLAAWRPKTTAPPGTPLIAEYHAIGASSYAASKLNIANPGIHDLIDGVYGPPDWDALTGWTFDGAELQYLLTDIYGHSKITVIVFFTNCTADNGALFGSIEGGYDYGCYIIPNPIWQEAGWCQGGAAGNGDEGFAQGILTISANKCYIDGDLDMTLPPTAVAAAVPMMIGAVSYYGEPGNAFTGDILAIAFYDGELTPAQVLAATIAMADLA